MRGPQSGHDLLPCSARHRTGPQPADYWRACPPHAASSAATAPQRGRLVGGHPGQHLLPEREVRTPQLQPPSRPAHQEDLQVGSAVAASVDVAAGRRPAGRAGRGQAYDELAELTGVRVVQVAQEVRPRKQHRDEQQPGRLARPLSTERSPLQSTSRLGAVHDQQARPPLPPRAGSRSCRGSSGCTRSDSGANGKISQPVCGGTGRRPSSSAARRMRSANAHCQGAAGNRSSKTSGGAAVCCSGCQGTLRWCRWSLPRCHRTWCLWQSRTRLSSVVVPSSDRGSGDGRRTSLVGGYSRGRCSRGRGRRGCVAGRA